MTTPSYAHGISLPLYAAIQHAEGEPLQKASEAIQRCLRSLNLEKDIRTVLVFSRPNKIEFEAETVFGDFVLKELSARSEFAPCPEGECDLGSNGICKWCGRLRH